MDHRWRSGAPRENAPDFLHLQIVPQDVEVPGQGGHDDGVVIPGRGEEDNLEMARSDLTVLGVEAVDEKLELGRDVEVVDRSDEKQAIGGEDLLEDRVAVVLLDAFAQAKAGIARLTGMEVRPGDVKDFDVVSSFSRPSDKEVGHPMGRAMTMGRAFQGQDLHRLFLPSGAEIPSDSVLLWKLSTFPRREPVRRYEWVGNSNRTGLRVS